MTVITEKQLRELELALPVPTRCEVCRDPLSEVDRTMARHGPFVVHVCPRCRIRLEDRRR